MGELRLLLRLQNLAILASAALTLDELTNWAVLFPILAGAQLDFCLRRLGLRGVASRPIYVFPGGFVETCARARHIEDDAPPKLFRHLYRFVGPYRFQ